MSNTYYIKPNGMSQGDLVKMLRDIATGSGGSYGDDYITVDETRDSKVDSKIVSQSKIMSTNKSIADSKDTSQSTLISELDSRLTSAGY